jgi:hypothetical protein
MAFKNTMTSLPDTFKLISRQDPAIDFDKSDYDAYFKAFDEKFLTFVPGEEPTRFVLKKNLTVKEAMEIQSLQVQIKQRDVTVDMAYLLAEARMILVGIENPANIPDNEKINFKKGADGYVHDDIFTLLHNYKILLEFSPARAQYVNMKTDDLKKS